jgi:hypothetical protein
MFKASNSKSPRTLSDPTAVSVAVLINDRIKTPVKHKHSSVHLAFDNHADVTGKTLAE